MAQAAYRRAIAPDTSDEAREAIRASLLTYCALNIFTMVRLVRWRHEPSKTTTNSSVRHALPYDTTHAEAHERVERILAFSTCDNPVLIFGLVDRSGVSRLYDQ